MDGASQEGVPGAMTIYVYDAFTKQDGTIGKEIDYLLFGDEVGGFYPAVPGGKHSEVY